MKINLAKSAGFCLGVRRAIDIALKTAASDKKIYMLVDIVHNKEVVSQLKKSGIKKIQRLAPAKGKILLVSAHGTSLNILKKARRLGYKIIDATCPMVKQIHKIAQNMEEKGYKIIIIGDKKHAEVLGIAGQLKGKSVIIEDVDSIPLINIKKIRKACVVVQSTQNFEKVMKILKKIRSYIKELKFFNTICKPTKMRQEEVKKMALCNDVMIIIGSKNSANTKRLFEISKSLNKRSFWINSKEEIKKNWLKGAKSAGITAGASTPDYTSQGVIAKIKKITRVIYH